MSSPKEKPYNDWHKPRLGECDSVTKISGSLWSKEKPVSTLSINVGIGTLNQHGCYTSSLYLQVRDDGMLGKEPLGLPQAINKLIEAGPGVGHLYSVYKNYNS